MAEKWSEIRTERPAGPLTGAEITVAVQGGQSVGLTYQQLKDWLEKKNNLTASTDPGANDDSSAGYQVGSKWKNGQEWWICSDATEGAAHWEPTTLSVDELGTAALAEVGQFLQVANNGSDIADPAAFRAALGLLGMALQDPSAVAITGGTATFSTDSGTPVEIIGAPGGSGQKILKVSKDGDADSYFAIETGTSGANLIPLFRAYSTTNDPALYLLGDSSNDSGGGGLVRISGRINNGTVTSRPLLQVCNVNDTKVQINTNGGVYSDAEIISSTYVRGGIFTVATLPSGAAEGASAHTSDGLKSGETTGNGTGVPVYYSNGSWRVQGADTPVQA